MIFFRNLPSFFVPFVGLIFPIILFYFCFIFFYKEESIVSEEMVSSYEIENEENEPYFLEKSSLPDCDLTNIENFSDREKLSTIKNVFALQKVFNISFNFFSKFTFGFFFINNSEEISFKVILNGIVANDSDDSDHYSRFKKVVKKLQKINNWDTKLRSFKFLNALIVKEQHVRNDHEYEESLKRKTKSIRKIVKQGLSRHQAYKIKKSLEEAGASVSVRNNAHDAIVSLVKRTEYCFSVILYKVPDNIEFEITKLLIATGCFKKYGALDCVYRTGDVPQVIARKLTKQEAIDLANTFIYKGARVIIKNELTEKIFSILNNDRKDLKVIIEKIEVEYTTPIYSVLEKYVYWLTSDEIVDRLQSLPVVIMGGLSIEEAEELKKALWEVGVIATIK